MYRRAYAVLVGVAATMGLLAIGTAVWLGKPLVDPDGFLGPSWLRLPMLIIGAFLIDVVPRTIWKARFRFGPMPDLARQRVLEHWTRERITLVVMGVACFYITYVSYRNLKSFLPFVQAERMYDRELYLLDRALLFGHDPATLLHSVLGGSTAAHVLSYIYLLFLPMVPIGLIIWLVWSRNISFGYWFATSQVLAWTFGTISYYALPTVGPGFEYPWLFADLDSTPSAQLMESLQYGRQAVVLGVSTGSVQSVAGFASLHCAITLLWALMAQYTLRSRIVRWLLWANFGITVVATLYFGWHYLADDVAGIMIALLSFYIGGIASGQVFDKHLTHSRPTTDSSLVPIDAD